MCGRIRGYRPDKSGLNPRLLSCSPTGCPAVSKNRHYHLVAGDADFIISCSANALPAMSKRQHVLTQQAAGPDAGLPARENQPGMSAETFPVLLAQKLKTFPRKLELGDFVLLIYLAAFVRQWFWIVNQNALAWVLTVLVSLAIWYLHLSTKDDKQKLPRQFWLVVALPLFVIYAMRAAFPDTSFDVLDYRLINSERALRGLPLISGDFFPVRFPFNPAPDMVTGISRHLLGYRLGT